MQRWMLQKHNRNKVLWERANGINQPFAKTERAASVKVAMPEHTTKACARAETIALCDGVKITRIPCKGVMPQGSYGVTGKAGARAFKRTYGDYSKRVKMGALIGG